MAELACWKCGSPVASPRQRSDRCPSCEADLYCCKMCVSYAPQIHRKCRNDRAEPPRDADRANFCDWLEPDAAAYAGAADEAAARARDALEELFKK